MTNCQPTSLAERIMVLDRELTDKGTMADEFRPQTLDRAQVERVLTILLCGEVDFKGRRDLIDATFCDECGFQRDDLEDTDDGWLCVNCRPAPADEDGQCPTCHGEGVLPTGGGYEERCPDCLADITAERADAAYDDR